MDRSCVAYVINYLVKCKVTGTNVQIEFKYSPFAFV